MLTNSIAGACQKSALPEKLYKSMVAHWDQILKLVFLYVACSVQQNSFSQNAFVKGFTLQQTTVKLPSGGVGWRNFEYLFIISMLNIYLKNANLL